MITERQWHDQVVKLADTYRWSRYHTFDSRRSDSGWPDLVLCKVPRLLFIELKTETGRIRPEQRDWLRRLHLSGAVVALWRPFDLMEAIRVLGPRGENPTVPAFLLEAA